MPYAPLPEIAEALDDLERRLRAERHPERKRRLHMLVLFKEDPERTRLKVAEHLAVHRNTIRRWLTLYREGGLDGLLTSMQPAGPYEAARLCSGTAYRVRVGLRGAPRAP